MKVAINSCYGGYSLSQEALQLLIDRGVFQHMEYSEETKGIKEVIYSGGSVLHVNLWEVFLRDDIYRSHPEVIKVIEELGDKTNGSYAEIEIIEIPDGTNYTIKEYDGLEHVAEAHKTWG